jgi:acyl carrier protein
MTTEQRIKKVISNVFSVPECDINEDSSPDNTENWSSLGHLTLVLAMEEEFEINISDQEAVEMLNFKLIRATLQEKGIE